MKHHFTIALAAAPLLAHHAYASQDDAEADAPKPPTFVEFQTNQGDFTVFLDRERAPITTEHIIELVEADFYDDLVIHRILPNDNPNRIGIIQGGGFTSEYAARRSTLRPDGITNEWTNGLTHIEGTIAMARLGGQPDSATTQWFINTKNNDSLNQPNDGAGYAVFGFVVEGLDVAKAICNLPSGNKPTDEFNLRLRDVPIEAVVINDAVLITGADITPELSEGAAAWDDMVEQISQDAEALARARGIEVATAQCARQFRGRSARLRQEGVETNAQIDRDRFETLKERLDAAEPNEDGITIVFDERGSGPEVGPDDVISVNLSMWIARTGEPIQQAASWFILGDGPLTIAVDNLPSNRFAPLEALQGIVAGSSVGSSLIASIPHEQAYGREDLRSIGIPAASDIVVHVDVLERIPSFDEAIEALNSNAQQTESGMDFAVIEEGEGDNPTGQDFVLTTYAGWLTDGTRFDTNTFRFSPQGVIPGWTESLTDMNPGEKRIVRIPPNLAYGARGAGDAIPPNATLVFYIHLREIDSFDAFLQECEIYQSALRGETIGPDALRPTPSRPAPRRLDSDSAGISGR